MEAIKQYWDIFVNGYSGYAGYIWGDITNPQWNSYFYWLLIVSAFFFILEFAKPWRKNQALLRKDFWLDFFYMFFNFFIFSLIIYNAASDVFVNLFNNGIDFLTGLNLKESNPMYKFPLWAVLIIGFLVRDFVQWWIHRLLHKSPKLWEFHKVHHSVEEMGFAAHLRYHWMENVVYRTLEYIPLALLGIGLYDFFIIHIFTLAWGHYNHSNISINTKITGGIVGALIGTVFVTSLLDINLVTEAGLAVKVGVFSALTIAGVFILGPIMKYLFNGPEMHIWHHAYDLPEERQTGVNFGLTLAIWDYIFGTNYIPHDGQNIRLGFPGIESFPTDFIGQTFNGIVDNSSKKS